MSAIRSIAGDVFVFHQDNAQLAFSEPTTFEKKQYTSHQTNYFCISQVSAVTLFRCDGRIHNHGYKLTVRFILKYRE